MRKAKQLIKIVDPVEHSELYPKQLQVLKFGGGCLQNATTIERVCEIIASSSNSPKVIVVSALFGVTDQLIAAIGKDLNEIIAALEQLASLHLDILDKLVQQKNKWTIFNTLKQKFSELRQLYLKSSAVSDTDPYLVARIISFGERISALLLAGILESRGIVSRAKDADRLGIITDSIVDQATPDIDITRDNLVCELEPLLDNNIVVVVTGYFASTPDGQITTFGRNGSDYSAALIAQCLGASKLEFWKAVDGYMSADPTQVPSAQIRDHLSYYEIAELSYFGASIIHPRIIEPLLSSNIEVRIRSIHEHKREGTRISLEGVYNPSVIKSIAVNTHMAILSIHGARVGKEPGIIGRIGQKLSHSGINILSVITSQTCINLLVANNDCKKAYGLLKPLENGVIEYIDTRSDRALLALVGEGLGKTPGIAARIFGSVAKTRVNIDLLSQSSDRAIYFLIHNESTKEVLHTLHRDLFE